MKETKKVFSFLMAVMMILGMITTPVQARGGESTDGWGWPYGGWWSWWGWQQPEPEPEPEPVVEEEPVEEEEEEETPAETPAEEAPEENSEVAPAEQAEEPVQYAAGTLPYSDDKYQVYVDCDETAEIPVGTLPVVTEFAEGSEEYNAAKAAVLGDSDNTTGFAAFDISLYNGDTLDEPNPNGNPVTVTVELKNLPAEAIAAADTLELSHINEVSGETEVVATAEEITVTGEDSATAEFTVDSFSTFTLTWGENDENEATIIWGYMNGDTFTELEEGSTVTLDQTAATVSILNSFDGYLYQGAVYVASGGEMSEGVSIQSTLNKTDDGWSCVAYNSEDGSETVTPIADGSVIYVNYLAPGEYTPPTSGAGEATVPSPTTEKTVTDNGDGTYTIQLDITGALVTEDNSHYVNVLVILDATRSMNGAKWTNAKAAMKTLIETMTEGDNAANAGKIDFALVTFGRSATVTQNWTKDNASFKTTCAGINMVSTSGTNWEAGMRGGLYGVLNNLPDDDPTYVIFLTDGDPNVYYSSGADTNYTNTGTTNGYSQNANTSANHSADEAKAIAAKTKLYGIYCGDSGSTPSGESYNRLVGVITGNGQGGVKTIAANADTIESEFKAIAETALKDVGAYNASVDDGVPSLAGISANVTGQAGGYEYYKKEKNESEFSEWADAPGAVYSNDNGVTWDLSKVGTLPEETTYRIKFTVWPSQDAYDLIADLNNGLKDYDDLTDKEKAAVTGNKDDGYTLVTNTHLNTNYTVNGKQYSDQPDDLQYKAMPLPTKMIKVKKNWPQNLLDGYGAATYRDENGVEQTATEITLNLQKDGANYLPVTVKADENWVKDDVYVSCGNMSINAAGEVTIHEPGHDYQIVEPAAFSYYWDLISDVYHPMVINGKAEMLILNEKLTAEDVDNETVFEINGKFYEKSDADSNTLEADNYRRSNLNLTKVVSTEGGQNDYFTYTAKVTDAQSSDGYVWFSAWDPEAGATVKATDWVVSGATAEDGNTGYWYAQNGATITLKIKAGWNVCFLNLYHGSTFSFEETDMPQFYEFENAEADKKYDFEDTTITDADWYKIEDKVVSGNIIEPNNSYTVTYTNKYEAFYVYHSGTAVDGNLEVIGMPAAGGTYDLTQNLTPNTLYGGYYLDYAGKGDYKDDGIKGTTGVKYTGMNYEWTGAQTVKGTEITPVAGETYYIKEVPTYYLRNYHQINYVKSSGKLMALYLISAVDDLNYQETGFYLQTDDKNEATKVLSSLKFKNYATNKTVTLKANSVFRSLGITEEGEYLTYYDATSDTDYFKVGKFTVEPYWITPDRITVRGISKRTITISSMTKSGISKSDD